MCANVSQKQVLSEDECTIFTREYQNGVQQWPHPWSTAIHLLSQRDVKAGGSGQNCLYGDNINLKCL